MAIKMKKIIYPQTEKIIELNFLAINFIREKKSDKAKVLSVLKIHHALKKCKDKQGDVYDKATVLLKMIIGGHPFESGNRRTAFLTVKHFLRLNGKMFSPENIPEQSKTMLGIREGYYTDSEIKEWLKNGKIREFKREKQV
jgi:death-on-curing family protein